jgi:hypothetical protein
VSLGERHGEEEKRGNACLQHLIFLNILSYVLSYVNMRVRWSVGKSSYIRRADCLYSQTML